MPYHGAVAPHCTQHQWICVDHCRLAAVRSNSMHPATAAAGPFTLAARPPPPGLLSMHMPPCISAEEGTCPVHLRFACRLLQHQSACRQGNTTSYPHLLGPSHTLQPAARQLASCLAAMH
jgi:hypothetical protein